MVRLKGGDPFVLGRGGEEAVACIAAGVAVEVVPGVTSAVAVPAAAGIPVTHRGLARQVTIASGHEGLDWASLARLEGTLVLLMGVSGLAGGDGRLIGHGKPAAPPVAIVEAGFTPQERTTVGTPTIAGLARERDAAPGRHRHRHCGGSPFGARLTMPALAAVARMAAATRLPRK